MGSMVLVNSSQLSLACLNVIHAPVLLMKCKWYKLAQCVNVVKTF